MSIDDIRRVGGKGDKYPPPFLGPAPHTDILGYQDYQVILKSLFPAA